MRSISHPWLLATLAVSAGCSGGNALPDGAGASAPELAPTLGTPASALRARFPDHAGRILDIGQALDALDDGFGLAAAIPVPARHGLDARLPREGAGAVRFTLPSGQTIEVRERGLTGAGALAGHAVAYAREGGTSYWSATPEGYEEWLLLEPGATAPLTWEVAGGTLRGAGDAVEVVDEAGVARMVVRAPVAYGEAGQRVPVWLSVQGAEIALHVDAGGQAVLVDPSWTATPNMTTAHAMHEAVLLTNGKVLVAGTGIASGAAVGSDLYDPSAGTWTAQGAVYGHFSAMVALASGKALLTGGENQYSWFGTTLWQTSATSFVYDSTTGQWGAGPSMATSRSRHTATVLSDGKVLVVGGTSWTSGGFGNITLSSAEIYDPVLNAFSPAASMNTARYSHTAVRLADGRVLVAGGAGSSAEIYDPSTNTWSPTGSMSATNSSAPPVLLPDGRVVLTTGATCEIFHPAIGGWSLGAPPPTNRGSHTAALLGDGRILVAGGANAGAALSTTDIYDPSTDTWSAGPSMITARRLFTATALPSGGVLVAGGAQAVDIYYAQVVGTIQAEILGGTGALGTACTSSLDCASGFCADGVCCNTACNAGACDACSVAAGASVSGTCTLLTGNACNDGNVCTQTDVCQNGVCSGTNPVVCPAPTTCQSANTCNPSTGACTPVAKLNGSSCDDGNACTTGETCQNGACSGGSATVCYPLDVCHQAGTCDPLTGCSNPSAPDGTACDDDNPCSQTSVCQAGVCTGSNPVDCPASDSCHAVGVCDPKTGTCSNPVKADGAPCDDSDACTQSDVCQAGACVGSSPIACPPPNACQEPGACNPVNGICSYPAKADGTACDDGDACTSGDTCKGGACTGGTAVVCQAKDECHEAGTCDPKTGTCDDPVKADGASCSKGACAAGACEAAPGGGGGAGSTGTTTGTGGTDAKGGCGCRTATAPTGGGFWVGLGLLAALRMRRRARG